MKLASRFKRLIAVIIDISIFILIMVVLDKFLMIFSIYLFGENYIINPLLIIYPSILLYFTLFEQSKCQATPGKMLFSIYIANIDQERLTLYRALARSILFIGFTLPILRVTEIEIFALLFCMLLAYIWFVPILFKSRRGLHDRLSKTIVLKR